MILKINNWFSEGLEPHEIVEEIVDVKLGNLELPIFTLGIDLDTIKNSRIAINNYNRLSKKNISKNTENSLMIRSLKSVSIFTNNKNNENIKKSILSYPLTYMGFSGYLNPFTHEYNINGLIPNNSIPMVMSHEIAHEIGFSSEMEANFIGYISLINSDNLYYQY